MPAGYGQIGTPWGFGGTTSRPGSYSAPGGGDVREGSNQVAEAVNTFQQAKNNPNSSPNEVAVAQQEAVRQIAIQQAVSGAESPTETSEDLNVSGIYKGIQSRIDEQKAEEAEEARIAALPKKGIFDAGLGTVQKIWKDFSPMMNVLQATQGKDRIFKKLAKGEALTDQDKIVLANLVAANKKNPDVLGDIDFEKYDVKDAKGFKADLDDEISDLEDRDYQSLVDDYLGGKPTGLKDSLFGMGSDLVDLVSDPLRKDPRLYREDDSLTLEGLKKELGPQGLAFLKANDPAAYYSFTQPQTGRGIENLANLQVTEKMQGENPDFANQIFAAREQVQRDRTQDRMNMPGQYPGGGGAGIPSLAAVSTPFTDVNNNGILDNLEVAQATTTPATTATTAIPATTTAAATQIPFDYSQWPQYTQQGIANPNLNPWYNTLQNYYG